MDRHVQPRLTYWTGTWHPSTEAISKEVEILRRQPGHLGPVVSFSARQHSGLHARDGVIKLAGSRHGLLHLLAALIEPRGRITHAFGAANAWHLLRVLGRRPLLFTVALPGSALGPTLYDKVSIFAAESEAIAATLRAAGVREDRIEVVYPGINLAQFVPAPLPAARPFRILFASTPAHVEELDVRGIPMMVEAARRLPDVEFVLLWRRWGDESAARRALESLDLPRNVIVDRRDAASMVEEYQRVHATIVFYAEGFGKSCPNSVVEGLACGRPALLSDTTGIASLVEEHGAGVVVPRTVDGMVEGIERMRAEGQGLGTRARQLAERAFGVDRFRQHYAALYQRLLTAPARSVTRAASATQTP